MMSDKEESDVLDRLDNLTQALVSSGKDITALVARLARAEAVISIARTQHQRIGSVPSVIVKAVADYDAGLDPAAPAAVCECPDCPNRQACRQDSLDELDTAAVSTAVRTYSAEHEAQLANRPRCPKCGAGVMVPDGDGSYCDLMCGYKVATVNPSSWTKVKGDALAGLDDVLIGDDTEGPWVLLDTDSFKFTGTVAEFSGDPDKVAGGMWDDYVKASDAASYLSSKPGRFVVVGVAEARKDFSRRRPRYAGGEVPMVGDVVTNGSGNQGPVTGVDEDGNPQVNGVRTAHFASALTLVRRAGAPLYAGGEVPMVGDVVRFGGDKRGTQMTVASIDGDGNPVGKNGIGWKAKYVTLVNRATPTVDHNTLARAVELLRRHTDDVDVSEFLKTFDKGAL